MGSFESNIPLWYFLLTVVAIIFAILFIAFTSHPTRLQARSKLIRRNIKKNYIALSGYLASFIIITIVATCIVYSLLSLTTPSKDNTSFDKLEKALTIGITAAGFLSVIASIKIWQDTDTRQVDQAVSLLFEKLQDTTFADIRHETWEVKEKWDANEDNYRSKLIANSFRMRGDKTIIEDISAVEALALRKDIKNVRRLFEFYASLIVYADKPDALIRCHYFYYDWWRSFLYEMGQLHDDNYLQDRPIKKSKFLDYDIYESNISYIKKLEKLDQIFHFEKVPKTESFY